MVGHNSKCRGTTGVDLVVVLAVVAVAGWLGKAYIFSDDKKNAKESEQSTEQLLEAQQEQSAAVAASVTSIGRANEEAPESPSKAFITREVPETLALLPEPSESALKAAETRRMAVMEGRLHEANRLYAELRDENLYLMQQRDAAIARRLEVDKTLVDVAKARANDQLQRTLIIGAALLLGIGWWTRAKQSVPLAILGRNIGQADRPAEVIRHLDSTLTPGQQKVVNKHAKLNTPDDK